MQDRLLQLLESVLGRSKKTSGNNYAFYSPFADHYKPKLEIDITLNSEGVNPWHCWISDAKGKTIRSLFKKLKVNKQTWDEYELIFKRKYKYNNSNSNSNSESTSVTLPAEYIPLWKPSNSIIRGHALNYLMGRGITPSEIIKYSIGYCESGKYRNKVIIPSYDYNGRLNYFVGRSFYDTNFKHKNPPISKDVIGFELFVNWDLPIVICEGAFDAIAIRNNSIPLFGKSPQSSIKRSIIEKGVGKIYIALDSDAFKNAIKFSEELMNNGVDVYLIELGESDPSDMGFIEFNKIMNNTEKLTFRKLMEYKLMNIC